MGNAYHDQTTLHLSKTGTDRGIPMSIGVTILFHHDVDRIGDVVALFDLGSETQALISRTEPIFRRADGQRTEALASPMISRKPIELQASSDGGIRIRNTPEGTRIVAEGELLKESREFSETEVQKGIVLELGRSVVLCLHPMNVTLKKEDTLGLVGNSIAIQRLRAAILNVADLEVPVLLHGESGVGKEIAAAAIHNHSKRADKPYICVNMSAIPPTLAPSKLFGHARGAFTGATRDHEGYFVEADGGTLFLDEVGDTAPEVQPVLLRAIENKKVQPVGGKICDVDVRFIAATDSNLEQAIAEGGFRMPLLQRLAGFEIQIPPLRERREDIGRLFIHFLRQELSIMGQADRLRESAPDKCWVPATLIAQLARYDWPGNVRQLQNVTRQLAISNRDSKKLVLDSVLARLIPKNQAKHPERLHKSSSGPRKKRPAELTDDEIIEVWRRNRFSFNATIEELDVSRTWLNERIKVIPAIRQGKDLSSEEITACAKACNHDLTTMADRLEVSIRGLQLQMKRLKLN